MRACLRLRLRARDVTHGMLLVGERGRQCAPAIRENWAGVALFQSLSR